MMEYKDVLKEAVAEMAPHKVAGYLYEVSQEFSRFYENCPVVGDDGEFGTVFIVFCRESEEDSIKLYKKWQK
jgi:arginyl-tRNA synthetase